MKKFAVTFNIPAYMDMVVEAKNETDAIDQIKDLLRSGIDCDIVADVTEVEDEDFFVQPVSQRTKDNHDSHPKAGTRLTPIWEHTYEENLKFMTEIVRIIRSNDYSDDAMGYSLLRIIEDIAELHGLIPPSERD